MSNNNQYDEETRRHIKFLADNERVKIWARTLSWLLKWILPVILFPVLVTYLVWKVAMEYEDK